MAISLNVSDPAAIPDLDTLKSTVSDWLDRNDIDDKIPVFIQMAEATFNRELRTPQMENTVTFSVSGEDTPIAAVASDYLAMRAIYVEGSPDRPLRAMAPSATRQEFDGSSDTPLAYVLVSGSIRLVPPPSAPLLVTMDYWAQIEPLSSFSPANWMLVNHPDAYLYTTLFYAEAYLDNSVRAGQWKALSDQIIDRINRSTRDDRFGAGPLVPNHVAQVRAGRC